MKSIRPLTLGFFGILIALFSLSFIPAQQTSGTQETIWTAQTITTTATSRTVACAQGAGQIGRKTLAVHSGSGSDGIVTVTAQLKDISGAPDITSAYLAVNAVAAGAAGSDTVTPSEAGGALCNVSAVGATTASITVTLRRE